MKGERQFASDFLIYGLSDPRTGAIHYIGKSKSALRRPRKHQTHLLWQDPTPKGDWVRSLHLEGLKYDIKILEEFDGPELLDVSEQFWVAQGRGLGWPLVNVTKGGKGWLGGRHGVHTRALISAAHSGRKQTPEQRRKSGEGVRRHHREHPRSAETREKLSRALTGRAPLAAHLKRTPEWLANMSRAQKARRERERAQREGRPWP